MAGPLDDSVIVVTGADSELGRGLALAIADAGARLALLGDTGALLPVVTELEARDAPRGDRRRRPSRAATTSSVRSRPRPTSWAEPWMASCTRRCRHRHSRPIPFEEVDDARWDAVWEATLQAALFVLQAGYAQMRGRGGRAGPFLFVTPTVSMSGAVRPRPLHGRDRGPAAARQVGGPAVGPRRHHRQLPRARARAGPDRRSTAWRCRSRRRRWAGPGDPETDLGPLVGAPAQ